MSLDPSLIDKQPLQLDLAGTLKRQVKTSLLCLN